MGFGNRTEYYHIYDYEADFFSSVTTYHGLVRIYNSRRWWARWFWTFAVATSFGLFLIQSHSVLVTWRSRPITTQITFEVPSAGIDFPLVTICNLNPVKKSKIDQFYPNMSNEVVQYITLARLRPEAYFLMLNENHTNPELYDNLTRLRDAFGDYEQAHGKVQFAQFFNLTGFDCADMIKSCSFGAVPIADCCELAEVRMTDLGRCYQLGAAVRDGDRQWRQVVSGAIYGLDLLLDVQLHEESDWVQKFTRDVGFKVALHTASNMPVMAFTGHAAAPGTKMYGALSVRQVTLLDKRNWGNCSGEWETPRPSADSELYTLSKHWMNYFRQNRYSYSNCVTNCLFNFFSYTCCCDPLRYKMLQTDVGDIDLPGSDGSHSALLNCSLHDRKPICNAVDLFQCAKKLTRNALGERYFIERWTRMCSCAMDCNRLEYNVEISASLLANRVHMDSMSEKYNTSSKYIKRNFVEVNLFTKDTFYEVHAQQQATSRTGVLSEIGGSMGLFLGMSLITMSEIFIFMLKTLWGLMCNTRRKMKTYNMRMQIRKRSRQQMAYDGNDAEAQMEEKYRLPADTYAPAFTFHDDLDSFRTMTEVDNEGDKGDQWADNGYDASNYATDYGY